MFNLDCFVGGDGICLFSWFLCLFLFSMFKAENTDEISLGRKE